MTKEEYTTEIATIIVEIEYDGEILCPQDLEAGIRQLLEASDGIKQYHIYTK